MFTPDDQLLDPITTEEPTAEELISEYSNLDAKLDVIQIEITEAKNKILTPELRAELEAVDVEFAPMIATVQTKLDDLKEQIAKAVISGGETVTGEFHQAVYVRPKPKWDNSKLEGLALAHPEIAKCKTSGQPYIQLRRKTK